METILELKNIKGQNDEIIVVNGGETEINDSDIDEYIKESDIKESFVTVVELK
mgnify:CR=1 FL=1